MQLLDKISDFKLNDDNKDHLSFSLDDYTDYLNSITSLDHKILYYYLKSLKEAEILNNSEAEIKDPLYLATTLKMQKINSLEKTIELYKRNNGNLTKKGLLSIHKILMENSLYEVKEGFRTDNEKFVGAFLENGNKRIDYIPIDFNEIESSVTELLNYFNTKNVDNPFIVPFTAHAVMAIMQAFNDGNTRLSRLIQHVKIWAYTNSLYNTNLSLPCIYLSKNYYLSLNQYRTLQKELAIDPSNENYNRWIRYNLNMLDEQLYFLNNNVNALKKTL